MEEKKYPRVLKSRERMLWILMIACITGSGCVWGDIVPASYKVRNGPGPPKSNWLGVATKNQILSAMGNPDLDWKEKRVLIYFWEESEWGYVYYPGQRNPVRSWTKMICFLQFDDQEVLESTKIMRRPDANTLYSIRTNWIPGKKVENQNFEQ